MKSDVALGEPLELDMSMSVAPTQDLESTAGRKAERSATGFEPQLDGGVGAVDARTTGHGAVGSTRQTARLQNRQI